MKKANVKKTISKEEYQRLLPNLQNRLYELHRAIYMAKIPVMIVFEGWGSAGKGDAIRTLTKRLDPRGFRVISVGPARDLEKNYPWMRRYWQKIPARGQIVIFDTSWYRRVLIERISKEVRKHDWHRAYRDIAEFEKELSADGALIMKFWFQISKKEQAKRFKRLKKDKLTAWQVTEEDSFQHKHYRKFEKAVEEMVSRTNVPRNPWFVVDAEDPHYAKIKILKTIIKTFEKRLVS